MNSLPLQDKVIVVMGGTTGLGLSASQAFLASGAKVVVVGRNRRNADAAKATLGSSALALAGDATHPDTAPKAIAAAVSRFGSFDGLYHVAGGSGRKAGDGPLHEISDDGWEFTMELNLQSLFHSNRAAVRQFLKSKKAGAILNMTSVLAFSPSPRHFATHAYATAKAAIIGLTRSCASYYAAQGIRFNAVAPALVETPMARRAAADLAIMSSIGSKQPLDGGRIGQPSDLDGAAVYLLSDSAKFVTGQVLGIDGGWSVSEGQWSNSARPTRTKESRRKRGDK